MICHSKSLNIGTHAPQNLTLIYRSRRSEQPKRASLNSSPPEALDSNPDCLCDQRLRSLDISFWTDVPISNEAAKRILSSYLSTEHPVVGFFDADLFVEDLIAQRDRYCSPVLVSGLFFWACVSTSAEQSYTLADFCRIASLQSRGFASPSHSLRRRGRKEVEQSMPFLRLNHCCRSVVDKSCQL